MGLLGLLLEQFSGDITCFKEIKVYKYCNKGEDNRNIEIEFIRHICRINCIAFNIIKTNLEYYSIVQKYIKSFVMCSIFCIILMIWIFI